MEASRGRLLLVPGSRSESRQSLGTLGDLIGFGTRGSSFVSESATLRFAQGVGFDAFVHEAFLLIAPATFPILLLFTTLLSKLHRMVLASLLYYFLQDYLMLRVGLGAGSDTSIGRQPLHLELGFRKF